MIILRNRKTMTYRPLDNTINVVLININLIPTYLFVLMNPKTLEKFINALLSIL